MAPSPETDPPHDALHAGEKLAGQRARYRIIERLGGDESDPAAFDGTAGETHKAVVGHEPDLPDRGRPTPLGPAVAGVGSRVP